jgi:hypothetical protein
MGLFKGIASKEADAAARRARRLIPKAPPAVVPRKPRRDNGVFMVYTLLGADYCIRLPYPRRTTSSAGLPFGVNPESSAPPRVRSVGHFQKYVPRIHEVSSARAVKAASYARVWCSAEGSRPRSLECGLRHGLRVLV